MFSESTYFSNFCIGGRRSSGLVGTSPYPGGKKDINRNQLQKNLFITIKCSSEILLNAVSGMRQASDRKCLREERERVRKFQNGDKRLEK